MSEFHVHGVDARVNRLRLSSDGNTLATCCSNGTLLILNVATAVDGLVVPAPPPPVSLARSCLPPPSLATPRDVKDEKKPQYLYINSPGGSVSAGMAIFDTMQFIPCDVSTVCFGMAASMGAFLLGAGAVPPEETDGG